MDQEPYLLSTKDLKVRNTNFLDTGVLPGLTMLKTEREASSSSYSMVLSGRMAPTEGQVLLHGTPVKPQKLFKTVALAGVQEIDYLERLVTVNTVVKEQIAWSQPWYKAVPRRALEHEQYQHIAEMLGLDFKPETLIGNLHVNERFRLRIALALISRPNAELLIVDDPDQVRTLTVRAQMMKFLKKISQELPVVVVSTNPDLDGIADQTCNVIGSVMEAGSK